MQPNMTSGYAKGWEDLRKQARKLENEIDQKLVSFGKFCAQTKPRPDKENEPLLGSEHVFESMASDLEQLLSQLTEVNDRLAEVPVPDGPGAPSSSALVHTIQRHREILQDYNLEFSKTKLNRKNWREQDLLVKRMQKDVDSYKSASDFHRRMEMYLKEGNHVRNSDRMVDEQINIAVDTRENLVSQRMNFKRLQTRVHDLSSRFPAVNSLLQRINLRKRRDSLVIGAVVGLCTFLMLLYAFH